MVAVVSGNGLGLINTSLTQLGAMFGGQAGIGQSRESQMVNIATGNLLLQDTDETLAFRGFDTTFLRTYNSRAQLSDAGQDGWVTGYERHVALTGTLNVAGSTMTLYTGDGQMVVFAYTSANKYTALTGGVAHDTLVYNPTTTGNVTAKTWTYTDGATQRQETYADHASPTLKGRLTKIVDGKSLAEFDVLYDSSNRVSEVDAIDNNGAAADALVFGYSTTTPTQLTSIGTRQNGVLSTQIMYGYDTFGRLSWVQTDLTPTNAGDNTWSATPSAIDGTLFRTTYTYVTASASDLRIASVTDSDGVTVGYTYQADGVGGYRVRTVTQGSALDGSLQTVTFNYTSATSTDVTDGDGRTWTYQFDAAGQLTGVVQPANANGLRAVTSYTYTLATDPSGAGNVTQVKTVLGGVVLSEVDNTYNASGDLASQWTRVNGSSAASTLVVRSYNAGNQVTAEVRYTGIDPDGPGAIGATGTLRTTSRGNPSNHTLRSRNHQIRHSPNIVFPSPNAERSRPNAIFPSTNEGGLCRMQFPLHRMQNDQDRMQFPLHRTKTVYTE